MTSTESKAQKRQKRKGEKHIHLQQIPHWDHFWIHRIKVPIFHSSLARILYPDSTLQKQSIYFSGPPERNTCTDILYPNKQEEDKLYKEARLLKFYIYTHPGYENPRGAIGHINFTKVYLIGFRERSVSREKIHVWMSPLHISIYLLNDLCVLQIADAGVK